MTPVAPLPAGSVLIHIGPHKTGTTALQAKLASAREELRERGVVYPGPRGAHHAEARAFLNRPEGFTGDGPPLKVKAWKRLVAIAGRGEGTVVLSSEFFAWSTAEDRARLVEQIDPGRIHLLFVARNPGAVALSTWQQSVSSGNTITVEDWLLERFRRDQPGVGGTDFWSWADAAALAAGWSEVLDPARIHAVVADPADRGLVPRTLEQLLGVPEGLVADQPVDAHNRSLTAPEVELLRATIGLVRDHLTWDEYSLFFRAGLARRLIYTRTPPADEQRLVLPAWAATQAAAEVESTITRLRTIPVHLVGDLANLRRGPGTGEHPTVGAVPTELAAQAAVGPMLAAQRRLARYEKRIAALEADLAEATARPAHRTPWWRRG